MFDLEEMEKIAFAANDCKCKLSNTYIEEFQNADDLIEDIRYTWNIIQETLGAENVRIWSYCFLSDDYDIKVKFKDGNVQGFYCNDGKLSQDIQESVDDTFYTYREMESDLKQGKIFEQESGEFNVKYPEEKEHCKKILTTKGYNYDISKRGDSYHFEYWKDSEKRIQEAFGTQKFDIEFIDKASDEGVQTAVIRGKDQEDAVNRFFKKSYNSECEILKIVPHGQKDAVAASTEIKQEDPINV